MSGEMTYLYHNQTVNSPFVLTSISGNPHLVYWDDGTTDMESFNLMLAKATDPNNDLLFVGGDFNNQPFSAWKRFNPGMIGYLTETSFKKKIIWSFSLFKFLQFQ